MRPFQREVYKMVTRSWERLTAIVRAQIINVHLNSSSMTRAKHVLIIRYEMDNDVICSRINWCVPLVFR